MVAPAHPHCSIDASLESGCREVYVGHNMFGADITWLPTRMLMRWWRELVGGPGQESVGAAKVLRALKGQLLQASEVNSDDGSFSSDTTRCEPAQIHALAARGVQDCVDALAKAVDGAMFELLETSAEASTGVAAKLARVVELQAPPGDGGNPISTRAISWAPTYASLPVLRAVVMRDPFTFAVSSFFWSSDRKDWPAHCGSAGCPGGAAWIEEIAIKVPAVI